MTVVTRHLLLFIVAVACFVVAFLIAVDAFNGNDAAWAYGGLAAFAGAHLP